MKKWGFAAILVILSSNSFAKVTYEDAIKADEQLSAVNSHLTRTNGFTSAELSQQTTGVLDWDKMPAGSKCGDYVMSGGTVKVDVRCQGYNVRYGCPSGFSHQNFGYFEAGNGDRMYLWCSKQ